MELLLRADKSSLPKRLGWSRQTCTGCFDMPLTPNRRRYLSTSSGGPSALLGLSESFTAGLPSASTTLQTSEIAFNSPSAPEGTQPTKSLVRVVPQPNERLTCPRSARADSSIESMVIASDNTMSLSRGSRPLSFHQAISSRAPSTGSLESGRAPFQSATQSGALRRNDVVPKQSGRTTRRLPPYICAQSFSTL